MTFMSNEEASGPLWAFVLQKEKIEGEAAHQTRSSLVPFVRFSSLRATRTAGRANRAQPAALATSGGGGTASAKINMRRGYSYSPSPPRSYRRRGRSPSPRSHYGGRGRDLPTSLLVRNLRRDCRPEDLRRPFGQFGRLKDIYLPRDYYTGEPRGFGFVQYYDPDAAADAKYYMDGQLVLGRAITVVFAEENRKKPQEMRARDRVRGRSYDRRYSRSRSPRYSRRRSPSRGPSYYSRSPSPPNAKHRLRERSYSHSPVDSISRSRSPYEERYGRSARRERSLSVSG